MLRSFSIQQNELQDNFYPSFYLFKKKIDSFEKSNNFIYFNLGDKNVLEILTDGEHAGQVFVEKGATFIKNSYVKRYNISELEETYISEEKNNQLQRSQLQRGDVLFTTIGNIWISAVVNENLKHANINQNVVRMRINEKKTNPYYLSCFLNSKITRFQVDNLFTGNIYPILTYPKIKSIKVVIKDKKTEKVITEMLKKAEINHDQSLKLIQKAQNLLKSKLNVDFKKISDSMFFSISQKEFSEQDMRNPTFFKPLYTNTIEAIKKNNETVLLGNIADFKNGDEVWSENYKGYLEKKITDIPFIRTSDLINYEIDQYPDFYIDEEIYESIGQNIIEDEILLTKDGKIGLGGMITKNDKCILGSGILRIVPKQNKINPYYLFTILSIKEIGIYQANQRTVIASTIPHLRPDRISDFVIPIVKDQQEIIDLVKQAFELKDERKRLIQEAKTILEKSLDF